MEPDDPPPKKYDFKPREFKRDNLSAAEAPPPPTAKELAMISGQRATVAPKPKAGPKTGDPNDVYQVLQQNRAIEQKVGMDEVEIKKIKSRRKRDYWLLLIGGNMFILGLVAVTGFNIISLVYGFAGVVIFSLSLTWIMWQVMDRY